MSGLAQTIIGNIHDTEDKMEFVQKKRGVRHTFTLHDDYFNFAYQDRSGSGGADISYAGIPQKSSVQIEQNEWLRNVGYLWIALGVFQSGYAISFDASLSGTGFWLVIGIVCVLFTRLSRIKYTVFRAEGGTVFVIQDNAHDRILAEQEVISQQECEQEIAQAEFMQRGSAGLAGEMLN